MWKEEEYLVSSIENIWCFLSQQMIIDIMTASAFCFKHMEWFVAFRVSVSCSHEIHLQERKSADNHFTNQSDSERAEAIILLPVKGPQFRWVKKLCTVILIILDSTH